MNRSSTTGTAVESVALAKLLPLYLIAQLRCFALAWLPLYLVDLLTVGGKLCVGRASAV